MSRPHLAFRNFRPSVIAAANTLFSEKPWREECGNVEQVAQLFADQITTAYDCAPVRVVLDEDSWVMGYEPADEEDETPQITLDKLSIFNLFRHVREHVLTVGGAEPHGESASDDPFRWACSLFYAVKPVMFRARVREGRIHGITARETYSADSWAKLEAAGFTMYDDSLLGTKEDWAAVLDGTYVANSDDDSETDAITQTVDSNGSEHAQHVSSLTGLSRDRIRALCVENGIPRQGRNKTQLITALVNAGVRP